jgi:hypothetical protein
MQPWRSLAIAACTFVVLGGCTRRNDQPNEGDRSAGPPSTPGMGEENRRAGNDQRNDRNVGEEARQGADSVERKLEQPTATGGGPAAGSRTSARDQLAQARCERFDACGEIASGKRYDTKSACVTREQSDLDDAWKSEDCDHVDQVGLDACLNATRGRTCDAKLSSMPSECDRDKVCVKRK